MSQVLVSNPPLLATRRVKVARIHLGEHACPDLLDAIQRQDEQAILDHTPREAFARTGAACAAAEYDVRLSELVLYLYNPDWPTVAQGDDPSVIRMVSA